MTTPSPLHCVLVGSQSLLIHCGEALRDRGHRITAVVSADRQIAQWAHAHDLSLLPPAGDLVAALAGQPIDYLFSITNLRVLAPAVLALPSRAAINFHDGPLPRYAGLYATAWALLHGEPRHGITWHVMTEQVDEGDLLLQRELTVAPDETSFSLNAKCYEAAIESFGALVDGLAAGTLAGTRQPREGGSYFGRYRRPDAAALLDWRQPAAALAAVVRALDFGPVENPLALPKLLAGGRAYCVRAAEAVDGSGAPGEILRIGADDDEAELVVAAGEGALAIRALTRPCGAAITPAELADHAGLAVGDLLASLSDERAALVTERNAVACRHELYWAKRLRLADLFALPSAERGAAVGRVIHRELPAPAGLGPDDLVAATAAWLGRLGNTAGFDLAYRDDAVTVATAGAEAVFADYVPLRVAFDPDASFAAAAAAVADARRTVAERGTYAVDLPARFPDVPAPDPGAVALAVVDDLAGFAPPAGRDLVIAIDAATGAARWYYDPGTLAEREAETLQRRFAAFCAAAAADPATPVAALPLLTADERDRVLHAWNDTARGYRDDVTLPALFEQQVARTPDAVAVVFCDDEITYRDLDCRANQLGHHLQALGVGPDTLVGVCVERSIEMVVACLGIQKAGGAYVPMDPAYPRDRLALMLEDSAAPVLVTRGSVADGMAGDGVRVVSLDRDEAAISTHPIEPPARAITPASLAYTIYTSGSTGRPKGVMVEHRNVVSFFVGMDDRIGLTSGTWLALTSLSFDISVLELFWTLTRGLKVVLHTDKADDSALGSVRAPRRHTDRDVTFSLMYFASDEGEHATAADKYYLLLEGAKFGDRNGFSAVWTPERHFHAFGGLYPNPSVASAALATITSNIHIRAGSCVLPLHSPIRVAEEWALVDNLSRGRVGIAFASGWQPNDFVIRPESWADRKDIMLRDIDVVRRLWRGETVTIDSPAGKPVEIRTLPRPIQRELPVWVTIAGNPETFAAAGKLGANVLTHLLGQSLDEVGDKIRAYREARAAAGHEGRGLVTLMLHSFVGPDEAVVRDTVREPMKAYLKSSVNLIKAAAWTFPTFKQRADATGKTPAEMFEQEDLSAEDMDALLEHSFTRYYETSGLFGTPEGCLSMVDDIKAIDVDDIACLLDYGVASTTVLSHLPYLNQVKERANPGATTSLDVPASDFSLAAQVRRHGVTHLQCTPSQMSMLLADAATRDALGGLRKVMIGGEAFPAALARGLREATSGDIINMYGPTETTIWSCTQGVSGREERVAIGRPIANTRVYILDGHRQPVPVGVAGELYIGGHGVVRGYHARPELTAERFVPDPFDATGAGRLYRTGDLARWTAEGTVDFLGRADFQVKLRGYRIELGEIEAYIERAPSVRGAVVMAREDVPGDVRLVAYVVSTPGVALAADELRDALLAQLPDYMVPSVFVELDEFPLTPNAKVDRKALPAPARATARREAAYVAPGSELESSIAAIWADALNLEQVGRDDNFFDLGGHSLLTVQVHRRLRDEVKIPLALTALFQYPTIRALAGFLASGQTDSAALDSSDSRAESRKASMSRRKALRDRRRRDQP